MAKYSSIEQGNLARKRIKFHTLHGKEVEADMRPMSGADYEDVVAAAAARAILKGGKAVDGDAVYGFALDCETVARAFVDPDSPLDKPEPFFEDADAVRKALDRDRIFTLAAEHRAFQDSASPLVRDMTVEQFWEYVVQHAEVPDGELPFETWPLYTQRAFVRTTCSRLYLSQLAKSSSTSAASPAGSSGSPTG